MVSPPAQLRPSGLVFLKKTNTQSAATSKASASITTPPDPEEPPANPSGSPVSALTVAVGTSTTDVAVDVGVLVAVEILVGSGVATFSVGSAVGLSVPSEDCEPPPHPLERANASRITPTSASAMRRSFFHEIVRGGPPKCAKDLHLRFGSKRAQTIYHIIGLYANNPRNVYQIYS